MRRIVLTVMVISFAVITFILGSLIGFILVLFRFPSRKTYWYFSRIWAKGILFVAGVKVSVKGLENILFDGPKIMISNHQGNFDIPILIAVLPVDFKFIVKKELFKVPFFGWYLRKREDISIDRASGKGARETLNAVAGMVSKGETVLVFPEGTRSRDGSIGRFKRGGMVLAVDSGAKIVPLAVSGSFNIQKKGSFWMTPSDVSVNIGTPKEVTFTEKESDKLESNLDQLRDIIISLMDKK